MRITMINAKRLRMIGLSFVFLGLALAMTNSERGEEEDDADHPLMMRKTMMRSLPLFAGRIDRVSFEKP